MSIYARQAYLETEIMQADPLQLIRMLYKGAIEAVGQARHHLLCGRIVERSRQITRTMEILAELSQALDLEGGGSVAKNLALLYDYMQQRLLDANVQQADAPLAEVERLLGTLQEAWEQCPAAAADGVATTASSNTSHFADDTVIATQFASPAHLTSWGQDEAITGYQRTYLAG
jgi:flagellar protein FliS